MPDLIALIRERVGVSGPLDADTPLLSSGAIDSFHVAELVAAIEQAYAVSIPLEAIGVDNFDTPRQMEQFIAWRRDGGRRP